MLKTIVITLIAVVTSLAIILPVLSSQIDPGVPINGGAEFAIIVATGLGIIGFILFLYFLKWIVRFLFS